MTASRSIVSDHVVIQCPACGARESAEAAHMAHVHVMVCRECGETWPRHARRPKARVRRAARRQAPGPLIVAERQPLVSYTSATDTAWKAKIEGDYWPEPRRPSRLPMVAAAVASALFLAGFVGARDGAVAALPDLAGLYAAIGLPVNLDRVAIEGVKAERRAGFDGDAVGVQATLRNLASGERTIPPLVAEWRAGNTPLGSVILSVPAKALGAGKSVALSVDLGALPKAAEEVELRFLRPGESLPAGGKVKLASG